MIFNPFRKSVPPAAVDDAYNSIVAQSRQPRFYAEWGVPDTVTGRFDMVSLHLILFLRRLQDEPAARPFSQALVDLFFRDMDRSIRELGVTDIGVPRKVKAMGNVFYGLANTLGEALDSGLPANVEAVLVRNVYGRGDPGAAPLAAYLIGEAAPAFAATLGEVVPFEIAGTLERAVADAAADAEKDANGGIAVLLSPACASFDQYKNFEVRGDAFVRHVAALPGVSMLVEV